MISLHGDIVSLCCVFTLVLKHVIMSILTGMYMLGSRKSYLYRSQLPALSYLSNDVTLSLAECGLFHQGDESSPGLQA